ncbi:25294_t:CDS:2, partial [Gigaspora margarita]
FLVLCVQLLGVAYTTDTDLDMTLCSCKIWVEDINGNRIAGDGSGHYHDCEHSIGKEQTLNFSNQTYYIHAKVEGSARQPKIRGPFNDNACFHIHGTVNDWGFDETTC